MELFAKSCAICRRRPRDEGGNGSCPLVELSRAQMRVRDGDNRCPAFRLGDRKTQKRHLTDVPKTEALF